MPIATASRAGRCLRIAVPPAPAHGVEIYIRYQGERPSRISGSHAVDRVRTEFSFHKPKPEAEARGR